jgi:hypothetical protein
VLISSSAVQPDFRLQRCGGGPPPVGSSRYLHMLNLPGLAGNKV